MEKKYENLKFLVDDMEFEIGLDFEQAKLMSNFVAARGGEFKDVEFFKVALQKYSKVPFLTDSMVAQIVAALQEDGLETPFGILSYSELVEYIFVLFQQAIDDESKKYESPIVSFNKDNTVNITLSNGKTYKLMYVRENVEEAILSGQMEFNSILELYSVGSNLIRLALQHERSSVKLPETIFLSLWSTQFDEENEELFTEVLSSLGHHMKDVLDSGVKKSKAVIKVKKN